ncbi:MAG: hypothetical protein ACRDNF_05340 [Streptosporangiaceae bacterium]
MSEGYTYTTISAHRGEPVRVGVSFYLDELAFIDVCGTKPGTRPFLSVSHGDVSVHIGPRTDAKVTAEDAQIARTLADQAAIYAAEVERLSGEAKADSSGTAAA